jgi:hypothetical protein
MQGATAICMPRLGEYPVKLVHISGIGLFVIAFLVGDFVAAQCVKKCAQVNAYLITNANGQKQAYMWFDPDMPTLTDNCQIPTLTGGQGTTMWTPNPQQGTCQPSPSTADRHNAKIAWICVQIRQPQKSRGAALMARLHSTS